MTFAIIPAITQATAELYGPRHQHDCDQCAYIGRMDSELTQGDVYFCVEEGEGTLIVRSGTEDTYCSLPLTTAQAVAERCTPGGLWSSAVLCHTLWHKHHADKAALVAD